VGKAWRELYPTAGAKPGSGSFGCVLKIIASMRSYVI